MDNNNGSSPVLWNRHFVIICLVNLLCFIAFHMLIATFPFYVKSLGGDDALAGVVAGIFSIASLITRPLVGWTLDNISRRLLLAAGVAGMCLLALSYNFVIWLPLIVGLRFLHGIAWACVSTSNNTLACDHIPRSRFAEGMGYFGVTATISMAISPMLGLALKDNFGFPTLFCSSAAIAACALAMTFTVKSQPLPKIKRVSLSHSIKGLLEKSALPASVTIFFFIMPYGAINTFIALYARESGAGSGGVYFTVLAVSCALLRVLSGRVADKHGERPIVYVGNICLILSMLALVLLPAAAGLLCSALAFGIGFGIMPPAMQAMAMRIAEPHHRGAASSTYLCAFDLGIGLGGIISGFLVKYLGHTTMFSCMILPALCSLLVYWLWAGKSESAFKKVVGKG